MSPEQDAPLTSEDVERGAIVTVGLSSVVLAGDGDDVEAIGHTMLLDLDDVDPVEAFDCYGRLAAEGGVTALLQSSPGSYHIWDLGVRDLDQQLLRALRTPSEALHTQQSAKRGRFILRAAPKWRVDAEGRPIEQYKDAPSVLQVRAEATDVPQSRPHLDVLSELHTAPIPEVVDVDPVADLLVGSQVVRSDYLTLDDDTKRRC